MDKDNSPFFLFCPCLHEDTDLNLFQFHFHFYRVDVPCKALVGTGLVMVYNHNKPTSIGNRKIYLDFYSEYPIRHNIEKKFHLSCIVLTLSPSNVLIDQSSLCNIAPYCDCKSPAHRKWILDQADRQYNQK